MRRALLALLLVLGAPVCALAQVPSISADPNNSSWAGEVQMTLGTPVQSLRGFKANCTAAGNVNVTYVDGSTGNYSVAIGTNIIASQVTTINGPGAGTTAVCTYSEMR
jgi:hypothetical protein